MWRLSVQERSYQVAAVEGARVLAQSSQGESVSGQAPQRRRRLVVSEEVDDDILKQTYCIFHYYSMYSLMPIMVK